MARDKNLTIRINAETKKFDKALKKAGRGTKSLQKLLKNLTKKSAIGFASVTAAVTIAGLSFAKFQKDFTQVVTLLDKSSFSTKTLEEGIKDLEKGLLDLRAASGESFEDLTQGLFKLISTEVPAEEAMNTLAIAANLAAAGGTNVAVAVDAITTSVNAFGLEISEAERVSQLFFLAQKNGATTVAELSDGLGFVASSARNFNVSLEEVLAATAAATLAGNKTSESFRGLNQIFVNVTKPTKEAAAEAARLGIEFNTTALRAKGLEGFLKDIINSSEFTSTSLEKLFSSTEASRVGFALAGAQNEAFTETLKQLKDDAQLAETFNNALTEANKTQIKSWKKMTGAIEAVLVVLGKEFSPLIIAVSNKITEFAKFLLNADSGILKITKNVILFIGAVTGLTTALGAVGLVLIAVRTGVIALSAAFGVAAVAAKAFWIAVTGPIGRIITAVTALGGAFLVLKNVFADDKPADDLKKVGDEIDEITEKEKKLQAIVAQGNEQEKTIAQEKIKNLKIVKEEVEKAINQKARETDLKIQEAQREADVLKQIREGAISEEIEAVRAKNEVLADQDKIKLNNELLNAQLKTIGLDTEGKLQIEKQLELNAIELENLSEKLLLAQEKEQEARDLKIEKQEEEREALEEIRQIELENQVEFNEIQKEQLLNHLTNQKQTTDKFLLDNINTKKKADQLEIQNREKFGKTIGAIITKFEKQRIRILKDGSKQEVESFAQTTNRLTALTRSKNAGLAAIGKIAALVQIGVDTARGAIAAYAALSGIPIVGPALGAAAAAALITFGAEQAAAVAATGALHGGLVTQGRAGVDDQPFLLSRGETIFPADITPILFDTFKQLRELEEGGGLLNTIAPLAPQPQLLTNIINETQSLVNEPEEREPQEIIIGLEDEATDFITARQRENSELSIGII